MMMTLLHILFYAIHLVPQDGGRLYDQAEALGRKVFSEVAHIERTTFPVTPEDRDMFRAALKRRPAADTLRILELRGASGNILGYAIVTNVQGKDQPITFGVVLDARLHIKHVEILTYREPYGGEVRNPLWLEQFSGKGPDDPLRAGRDIRNITGATISVRSVIAGIQDILTTMRMLKTTEHAGGNAR